MPRCINKIQLVDLAVARLLVEADTLRLDCDTALALAIHGVENLFFHLARAQATAVLDKPVSQSRFTVIDMRDNREIADVSKVAQCIGLDCSRAGPDTTPALMV